MVTPAAVLQIDLDSRARRCSSRSRCWATSTRPTTPPTAPWAEADDGTRVPISVVHRRDMALPAPCLLYGYGAYEISIDPAFSHHRLSLLDRGLVYAVAHVRGGGEMGRAWYEDGRMEHKANTFSDFIACARHLVAEGIARPDALAGRGGSAGGLLIGAVANAAPELFAALVAQVPFVDCVTTMLDDEPPAHRGRVGGVGQSPGRRGGLPAHAVVLALRQRQRPQSRRSPRTYPDLLVTGGLNDPRVSYWEPAKWVAKIRALSPVDQGAAPDRAGGRPRRALRPLRRVEGGGAGLRLPARRARDGPLGELSGAAELGNDERRRRGDGVVMTRRGRRDREPVSR